MKRFLLICVCLLWPLSFSAQDSTEGDGGRISRLIESSLSGPGRQVTVRGFEGALSSRATIKELIFSDANGPWFILKDAAFDWKRSALLRRRLSVNELVASELQVLRKPNVPATEAAPEAAAATEFALPELPVSVEVNRFAIDRIQLGEEFLGETVIATLNGKILLIEGEGLIETSLERQNGPAGDLRLNGSYSNETKVLSIDVSLDEAANGIVANLAGFPGSPSVALKVKGLGPLDQFRADLNLNTDDAPRLVGQVRLDQSKEGSDEGSDLRFSADLSGDVAPLFDANYQEFLGRDLKLDVSGVRRASGAVELDTLDFKAAAISLQGDLALSDALWPKTFNLTGEITPPDGKSHVLLPLPGPETDLSKMDLAVSFDHEAGDNWTASLWVQGLEREALALGAFSLLGEGTIKGTEGELPGAVTANLIVGATELALGDPKIDTLLAEGINATTAMNWQKGGTLNITAFDASAAGAKAKGSAVLSDIAKGLNVSADLMADIVDLSLYANIAGLDLAGQASVTAKVNTSVIGGTFDFDIKGKAQDLSLGDDNLDEMIGGESEFILSAKRDTSGTTLRQLTLDGRDVAISADGNITPVEGGTVNFKARASSLEAEGVARLSDMQAGISVDADATLRASDLSEFAALVKLPIAGQVSLDVSGGTNLQSKDFKADAKGSASDLVIGIPAVDELIGGIASLEVVASKTGESMSLTTLSVGTQQIDISAKGALGAETGDFTFDAKVASLLASGTVTLSDLSDGITIATKTNADVQDLADFAALAGLPLAGNVSLDLDGSGNLADLNFDAEILANARDLVTGIAAADDLLGGVADVDISASRDGTSLDIRKLAINAEEIEITASGGVDDTGGRVDFDARVATAAVNGYADLSDMNDGITIQTDSAVSISDLSAFASLVGMPLSGAVELALDGRGNLKALDFDAEVEGEINSVGIGIAQVDQLLNGATKLRLDADKSGDKIILTELTVDGTQLSLDASGEIAGDTGSLRFSNGLKNLGIVAPGLTGGVQTDGTLSMSGDSIAVDVDVAAEAGLGAAIDGTVSKDFKQMSLTAKGSAPLNMANGFIEPRSIIGSANYDLQINGPPALNSVSGQITIDEARASAPTFNLALNDIATQINLSGGNVAIDMSTNVSQGGQVRLNGTLNAAPPFNTNMDISLDKVRLTDPALYDTTVSGEVTFVGPATGGARIDGTINLGETNVRIPTAAVGVGSAPDGLVHVNETSAQLLTRERAGFVEKADSAGGPAPSYPINLAVNADQRITIRGRGLDLVLGGGVRVLGTTDNLVTEGEFDLVRGFLNFLSKRLTLEEANIALLGGLTPFIHIEAVTDIPEGDATIIIDGPAVDPDFEFSSDPDLPDDEVLAQILFGKSLDDLSALQTAQLAASVAELTGGKSLGLLSGIRDSLGLDDLNLESDSEGNATVRAGRQLTEDVYTDLAVDSEGETEININLDVTDSLTAKASVGSDGESSLGLFFQLDY
ncbi:MAG: translocation/assembly module TamB domain-containing protein [Pseudoruegeria sp.]